jgi:hypothetical protein
MVRSDEVIGAVELTDAELDLAAGGQGGGFGDRGFGRRGLIILGTPNTPGNFSNTGSSVGYGGGYGGAVAFWSPQGGFAASWGSGFGAGSGPNGGYGGGYGSAIAFSGPNGSYASGSGGGFGIGW